MPNPTGTSAFRFLRRRGTSTATDFPRWVMTTSCPRRTSSSNVAVRTRRSFAVAVFKLRHCHRSAHFQVYTKPVCSAPRALSSSAVAGYVPWGGKLGGPHERFTSISSATRTSSLHAAAVMSAPVAPGGGAGPRVKTATCPAGYVAIILVGLGQLDEALAAFGIRFTSPWRRRSRPSPAGGRSTRNCRQRSASTRLGAIVGRSRRGSRARRRSGARSTPRGLARSGRRTQAGQRPASRAAEQLEDLDALALALDGHAIDATEAEALARVALDRSAHQDVTCRTAC